MRTNYMQPSMLDYQLGDVVPVDAETTGKIVELFPVRQADLFFDGDDPLPVGTTIYRVQTDLESWCYATNESIARHK